MASYTREEAREQAVKAGRYFGRALAEHEYRSLAVECGGAIFVVARADSEEGKKLRRFANEDLGLPEGVEKPTRAQQTAATRRA